MAVQKGVECISYEAGGTIGQYEPVKRGSTANQVVVPTATSDIVVGVSQIDATSGEPISVCSKPGAVVLMRVGSGGVTDGDPVGIDSGDKTEIATITEAGNGSTLKQIIGYAEETGVENQLIPVRLTLSKTMIA